MQLLPMLVAAALAPTPTPAPAPDQAPPPAKETNPVPPKGAFVSLKDEIGSVIVETRYLTKHNFIGKPIDGYEENVCLLTKEAANALKKVQRTVRKQGYTIKAYDCFRPQRAVDQFVRWSETDSSVTKKEFYPSYRKDRLFPDGFIARKSGHSRGSTVDLTLVKTPARKQPKYFRSKQVDCTAPKKERYGDNSIDMGTGFDCFSPKSHPFEVKGVARKNRMLLRRPMLKAGFKPLATEWWHFTLKDEPFPDTFFDAPVAESTVSR